MCTHDHSMWKFVNTFDRDRPQCSEFLDKSVSRINMGRVLFNTSWKAIIYFSIVDHDLVCNGTTHSAGVPVILVTISAAADWEGYGTEHRWIFLAHCCIDKYFYWQGTCGLREYIILEIENNVYLNLKQWHGADTVFCGNVLLEINIVFVSF